MYQYLWIVQLVVALAVGLLVVRQIKDVILAIIIRLLPRRYRISENSINLHARVSTITSFVLVFLIGGCSYWGLGKAKQWVTISESQSIVNIPPIRKTNPTPPLPKQKETVEPPEVILPAIPDSYDEEILEPMEEKPQRQPTVKVVRTRKKTTYPNVRISATPRYYLQVNAYKNLEKAQLEQQRLQSQWNVPCKIGVHQIQAHAPYKLLLGGFDSQSDTQIFKRKYGLSGFARAKSFFDYIIE